MGQIRRLLVLIFFFNDTATTEIYTLSLHDALPIWARVQRADAWRRDRGACGAGHPAGTRPPRPHRRLVRSRARQPDGQAPPHARSEEHTSELQSRQYLVCRLLLEKKKTQTTPTHIT